MTLSNLTSCQIWPSEVVQQAWGCWELLLLVCDGAELGGLNLNFEDVLLDLEDVERRWCCGESVVHSSVEEETQLPTELREGLCWFELDPSEDEFPFGHEEAKCSASSLIQGCRRTSSSKILCVASIRRHCAIKSWHSVNTRKREGLMRLNKLQTQRAFQIHTTAPLRIVHCHQTRVLFRREGKWCMYECISSEYRDDV